MKKMMMILSVLGFLSCNSALPEGDEYMEFETYKVPVSSSYVYWYVVEKNGIYFYFSSTVELTNGSQITSWDHGDAPPPELRELGTIQLPNDKVEIEELPLELRWQLGY